MNLNLSDIKDMAANPAVFSRAQSFYFSGGLIEYYVTYDTLDLYQIFAVVHEDKEYKVHISLDEQSKITDETCECKGFHTKFGACKHVIAVLLKVLDDQNRNKLTIHKSLDSDDDLLLDLIDLYEQQLMQDLSEKLYEADVLLLPKLVFNKGYETSIECSIGKTRTYVVKDIYKLCQDIRAEEFVSYGKELEFRHSLATFEPESQQLVRFICSVSDELNTYIEKLTQSRAYFTVGTKDLYLSPTNFDQFFDLYRGKTVACKTPDYVLEQVILFNHNPELEFKLTDEETEYVLSHNLGMCTLIEGQTSKYLLTEGSLYRLDADFSKNVLPLLKRMGELPYYELKMNEAYMGKFLSVLLPNIKKYLRHSSLSSLYDKFEVYPLNTTFYLDSDVRGALTLRVEFQYGDIVFDGLDSQPQAENSSVLRDGTKEAGIHAVIKRHHFNVKKTLYRLDDEDFIYDFIQYGIHDLTKIGEVFASEAFKKIK
ncbi:MAG TPA: helicase, partial [Firmicutes bacterium]|nr:helicase [Bacillota bacterium]